MANNNMGVVMIKDGTGKFTPIPYLRGQKGESGVYVGSIEPTDEDTNIWVDPNDDYSGNELTTTDDIALFVNSCNLSKFDVKESNSDNMSNFQNAFNSDFNTFILDTGKYYLTPFGNAETLEGLPTDLEIADKDFFCLMGKSTESKIEGINRIYFKRYQTW